MQSKVKGSMLGIPAKLYRIGELVRHTPFSRQTIHNYTIMGLIREAQWTEGGHRLYDESVFKRLSRVIELKRTRTLSEIRKILTKEEAAKALSVDQTTGIEAKPAGNRSLSEKDSKRAD